MKKQLLIAFAIIISMIVILNGCQSDQKQAANIQKTLEKAVEYEKDFAANQTELNEMRKNAQLLYNDLINLDINDKDKINQIIEEGFTYTKKQQQEVEEAKENFQKAYQTSSKIEKHIKKIKHDDQKNQATKLLTVMKERKKLIDSFFENYLENLKIQNTFYQQFKEENINLESLNEQITEINQRTQDMGETIQKFNQYTKQYMEAEKAYFQMN
ncbi:YkyA family protein [Niallia endozanthoxylica]|uniref:Cell-wall binding lipoprotein n=1 Tax=Niallia endozanthoxylica TaxID=2036016 RepID=A0A5J5HS07_9BACI|nr:YkyA family protein [Niallia endozanthoxylica]KAA9023900.1 hypothetical protein F4V44_12240 [Niallia endozanthoxylica]